MRKLCMEKAEVHFNNHIIMIGFGCIGQALLHLLIDKLNIKPSRITMITSDNTSIHVAQKIGMNFQVKTILHRLESSTEKRMAIFRKRGCS